MSDQLSRRELLRVLAGTTLSFAGCGSKSLYKLPQPDWDWMRDLQISEVQRRTKGDGVKIALLDSGVSQHSSWAEGLSIKHHRFIKCQEQALPPLAQDPPESLPSSEPTEAPIEDAPVNPAAGSTFVSSCKARCTPDGNEMCFTQDEVEAANHGTQCASVILGARLWGVDGVAPEAEILSFPVTDSRGEPDEEKVTAAFCAAAEAGVDIISCSFTMDNIPDPLRREIDAAHRRGTIIVVAAGNKFGDPVSFPFQVSEKVIAVAGIVDQNGRALPGAVQGDWISVAAPAAWVWSMTATQERKRFTDTSAATAIVSGVTALMLSLTSGTKRARLAIQLPELMRCTASLERCSGSTRSALVGAGLIRPDKLARLIQQSFVD